MKLFFALVVIVLCAVAYRVKTTERAAEMVRERSAPMEMGAKGRQMEVTPTESTAIGSATPVNLRAERKWNYQRSIERWAPTRETTASAGTSASPERQRVDQIRAEYTAEYGEPRRYSGRVIQRFDKNSLLLRGERDEFVLDCYFEPAPEGQVIWFTAWKVEPEIYVTGDGARLNLDRYITSVDPLPRWDKFGKPINRNGAETEREIKQGTSRALDRK